MTPADCGSCRFLTDATAARTSLPDLRAAADEASLAVGPAEQEEARLVALAADLRQRLASARASLPPVRGSVATLAALRARITAGQDAAARLDGERERLTTAEGAVVAAATARGEATAALTRAETEGRAARLTVARLEGADVEGRRLDVAVANETHVRAAHASAESRRAAAVDALAVVEAPPDLSTQRRAVAALVESEALARLSRDARRAEARTAAARVERARGALEQFGDLDGRAAELTATRERLALRRAGYAEIERAFGRDGIQALEIDAAGPEVSRLTNELLAVAAGGRFAVSLVTLQEAEKGRKQREVFDLRVLDGDREHGGIAFDRLSMGEQCLVGEALKLALAVHNTRRSGRELRTLYRDEGDRDLDPERRAAYPAMLRRAMELGGFTRCFLISHSPEVWSQADAVIRVEGGRAWIE